MCIQLEVKDARTLQHVRSRWLLTHFLVPGSWWHPWKQSNWTCDTSYLSWAARCRGRHDSSIKYHHHFAAVRTKLCVGVNAWMHITCTGRNHQDFLHVPCGSCRSEQDCEAVALANLCSSASSWSPLLPRTQIMELLVLLGVDTIEWKNILRSKCIFFYFGYWSWVHLLTQTEGCGSLEWCPLEVHSWRNWIFYILRREIFSRILLFKLHYWRKESFPCVIES